MRTYEVKKKSVTKGQILHTPYEMVVVVKTIQTKSRMLPVRGGREEGMLSVLWAHSQFGRTKPFRREHTNRHHLMLPSCVL